MQTLQGTLDGLTAQRHKLVAELDTLRDQQRAPDQPGCECRKPKPGLLRMIAERFEIDPAQTPVVGDSLRDLQAGAALGFPTHLVRTGKGEKTLAADGLPDGTQVHDDLRAFAFDFLAHEPA